MSNEDADISILEVHKLPTKNEILENDKISVIELRQTKLILIYITLIKRI